MAKTPLLEVRDADFSYGPLQVLFDVSIAVREGERVALLGTNGAGKSTLLRLASGLARPSRGSVWFDGQDITALSAPERVKLGLVQVNGGKSTFPSLTVHENLRIGAYTFIRDEARISERIDEVVAMFPVLGDRFDQPAGTLSGGEQQMVALGRAVVAGPRLVIIDELSLGLAPIVMEKILELIDVWIERGVTLLIVEQSLDVACAICERAYFMEKGEVRFSGSTTDLVHRRDLVRSVFFGDDEVVA